MAVVDNSKIYDMMEAAVDDKEAADIKVADAMDAG